MTRMGMIVLIGIGVVAGALLVFLFAGRGGS